MALISSKQKPTAQYNIRYINLTGQIKISIENMRDNKRREKQSPRTLRNTERDFRDIGEKHRESA